MEDFQFRPSFLQLPALHSYNGEVYLPGSKSITNRVLLISALAEGNTRLHNLLKSDDTRYWAMPFANWGATLSLPTIFPRRMSWAAVPR